VENLPPRYGSGELERLLFLRSTQFTPSKGEGLKININIAIEQIKHDESIVSQWRRGV
jgi:hypothetical protein